MKGIQRTEFFDREKEKEEILHILRQEPQEINFIYGPINSGKTSLITNLIENLPDDYVVFYVNLRRKSIIRYEDFIRVLFAIEEGGFLKKIKNIFTKVLKHITSTGEKTLYKSHGIPVDKSLLETFFKEKSNEDVFNYLVEYFKNIAKHKTPVLVIDELQMIGDLEINGKLIYKLFNFFIGLTKELHICHVFALSSDSLFIEKVYNEAILKERCRYVLVDEFDEKTTLKFLEKYKVGEDEQDLARNCLGGKPGMLTSFINTSNRKDFVEDVLTKRKGDIEELIFSLEDKNTAMFEKIINVFKNFINAESVKYKYITDEILLLVGENIIFVDPYKKIMRMQSKTDLLAVREILKELK